MLSKGDFKLGHSTTSTNHQPAAFNTLQLTLDPDPWGRTSLPPWICGKAQLASTPDQLEAIYRFRYEILCDIHHKPHPEADHTNRRLTDELDLSAFNAFVPGPSGLYAVGRLVPSSQPIARSRILAAGGRPFLDHFGEAGVVKVGRLCQIGNPGGAMAIIAILKALLVASIQAGFHAAVFTTQPKNRSLFERLGCRYFGWQYQHAYLGQQIGMCLMPRDADYLRKLRSPLAAAAEFGGHLESDARWYQNTFSSKASDSN
jgi:hypothetical protein